MRAGLERTCVQLGRSEKFEEAVMKWIWQQLGIGVSAWGVEIKNAALR